MAGNDLIATEEPVGATDGAGAIDGVTKTVGAISDGNWAEGLLSGVGAAGDVAGLLADPLAGLAAAGFGWLMEHVSFLKEPLDALTGDQQAIDAMSTTWENIGQNTHGAADDLRKAVAADTAPWRGPAVEAYKPVAATHAALIDGVGMGCGGAATAVKMCGIVLSVVREIVRDLISQAVGELVAAALEWLAAEALSFGLATPGMVADLVRRAVKWAKKISEWTDKVTKVLKKAWDKLDELGDGVKKVKDVVEKLASKEPFGAGNKINRQQIGSLGLGKGETHFDFTNEIGNKLAGKAKEETAKGIDDTYNPDDDT